MTIKSKITSIENMESMYFIPSVRNLIRITNTLMKKGATGMTRLSRDTHLNYVRLAKNVVWMENKGLVKSIIEENHIKVGMTEDGRKFSTIISNNEMLN